VIKINLKPAKSIEALTQIAESVDSSSAREIQRKGLSHILLMMILPAFLYVYGMQVKPEKKREIQVINGQIAELMTFNNKQSAIVAEIQKIEKDEKDVETRISAINNTTIGRLVEVKVLDLLQTIIREKMWLKLIEVKDNILTLEGLSQTDVDISLFLEDLTKNVLLRDVRLIESKQESFEGLNYSRFKIAAVLEKSK
jgi:type IV pilus assembly protein PilN